MGLPASSLPNLFGKVWSWITWGASDTLSFSRDFDMLANSNEFNSKFENAVDKHQCQKCGGWICGKSIVFCEVCDGDMKCYEKVHSVASHGGERNSSESIQSYNLDALECRDSFGAITGGNMASGGNMGSFYPKLSPISTRCYANRGDEEEAEDSRKHIFSPSSESCQDSSDIDTHSTSFRHNCKYSPFDSSPSNRNNFTPNRNSVQSEREGSPKDGTFNNTETIFQKSLDFENNGLIWYPPSPEDVNDDAETSFSLYDDEDDEIGDSGVMFSSSSSLSNMLPEKEGTGESLRVAVQAHFRALVAQLLQGEGIDTYKEEWLDIISNIALQAAKFVKPDTSRGGSMDPGDYVKVKCIASGSPSQSILVKGVVCTKNIKHKRMTSQYKNPRLLLLGGALEYQRTQSQLASFNTLLQQENDHLKMIIGKIEALRPNVLLVEKTVSSYAQQYLLEKEISLVLNVKRPLLERIARCTGGLISPSVDNLSTMQLGRCELFRLEKVVEEHEVANKKPSKTLMLFEGCPRRLGCTVLLRGSTREELKKVKHAVQFAVFAAYHLSLETSFLADEGATLPMIKHKHSHAIPNSVAQTNLGAITTICVEDDTFIDFSFERVKNGLDLFDSSSSCRGFTEKELQEVANNEENTSELAKGERIDEDEISGEYLASATETHQSILVSFSSRCVIKRTICERSRLLRIKFYGSFDKPLGRYLLDNLFDKTSRCRSCKEAVQSHVLCYTHEHGNLTINVRRLSSVKLSGEQDGKIWMWHRCLRCAHVDGVPPATRRVVMSDAAWGLSLGKFLELSFSNHATANRVATCGHSLQKDCLRFYGFGSMVAFFRYSPIDILSVRLPPLVLEVDSHVQSDSIRKEASELLLKIETMYTEISDKLVKMEIKFRSVEGKSSDTGARENFIVELKDQLSKERHQYNDMLQSDQMGADNLELNRLKHTVLIRSNAWNRQLYLLNSLLEKGHVAEFTEGDSFDIQLKELRSDLYSEAGPHEYDHEENISSRFSESYDYLKDNLSICTSMNSDEENNFEKDDILSPGSSLSEKIDSAWIGMDSHADGVINHRSKRFPVPVRVQSFESALKYQEKNRQISATPSLSTIASYRASKDYNRMRTYSQILHPESHREGNDILITVYVDDPGSIISYAINSEEHADFLIEKVSVIKKKIFTSSSFSGWQSFGSSDLDYTHYKTEDNSSSLFMETKKSPHLTISLSDDSSGKVKFSVTCYFAKEFDSLRAVCCPSYADFVRSLSRCQKWNAQGGKSNVYFAKSLDERFVVKQVTKTELESFEEFAPKYFKYLTESLHSGSPTCLAKILGIYQVSIKQLKSGKETKMDLMVMENLFFKRNISRVYDLKGSIRSRYNSDTSGTNNVLLDMNLLETLRTDPIFLGSKAKRTLERAIWNDTSFLAAADVMDYSLLVGVDEDRKELVLGIIDYMRQYTWDKHLETWVKASGILGGPKNASPTIISPKQYKKRFRKAMTTYFLTVPDQWSS